MFIRLTVENFKSFLDPTTISMSAGKSRGLPGNLLRKRTREKFVKSLALYGPNASGKTTVLDALYAIKSFVLFSAQDQKPTAKIHWFEPFALDRKSIKKPSRISVVFETEGKRYTYDVVATTERVWWELLVSSVRATGGHVSRSNSGRLEDVTLIDRKWNPKSKSYKTTLDDELGPELTRIAVEEQTNPNRLMLGKLSTMNSLIAQSVFRWFDQDLSLYDMHRNRSSEQLAIEEAAEMLRVDEKFASIVRQFIKDADTGIADLRVVEEEVVKINLDAEDGKRVEKSKRPNVSFQHATKDGSLVFLPRDRESSGTQRFFALVAMILKPSERQRLICFDEISASLHPDLVRRLIKVLHCSEFNAMGNQLLFTTHDTHLIDPSELLRRDQVVICTKNRFGESSVARLDEFEDVARSDANLEKQYLQGRFRGIPRFGPSLEDIPADDDSMEVL